jgi:hypothetical protein
MKHTAEGKEIYDPKGFAFLTISLAMEYYWKGLDICGGVAPGMAAAFAIAILIRSLVDENKWCTAYQTIVPSAAARRKDVPQNSSVSRPAQPLCF